jgi:hypothetical protein
VIVLLDILFHRSRYKRHFVFTELHPHTCPITEIL